MEKSRTSKRRRRKFKLAGGRTVSLQAISHNLRERTVNIEGGKLKDRKVNIKEKRLKEDEGTLGIMDVKRQEQKEEIEQVGSKIIYGSGHATLEDLLGEMKREEIIQI